MSKLRYFIPLCAVLLLLSLTGCAEQNDNNILIKRSGEFTDGTYTESAKGKNGKFDVTVVIKDGVIAEVIVGDNKETPDKGGVAIKQIPQKIVDEQSYDVDTVSGATVTSDGIKDAVMKCLRDASSE